MDVTQCEDAHAQERTLVAAVVEHAQQGDLWIANRNLSTTRILFGLEDMRAAFSIREHGRTPSPTEVGKRKKVGCVETGVVFEQTVQVKGDVGRILTLRRIGLQLYEPTEEGEPSFVCSPTHQNRNSPLSRWRVCTTSAGASKACFRAWSPPCTARCGR